MMYNDKSHEGRAHCTRCKLRIFLGGYHTGDWRLVQLLQMHAPRLCSTDSIFGEQHIAQLLNAQKAFFSAETGNALTTVLAGLALTMTTFPKTSLLPAFVAGFKRVLIMHSPGSTNLPAFFTSFAHTAFFSSVLSESAWARAPPM